MSYQQNFVSKTKQQTDIGFHVKLIHYALYIKDKLISFNKGVKGWL